MNRMIIEVEAATSQNDYCEGGCGCCNSEPSLSFKETTVGSLVESMSDFQLHLMGLVRVRPKGKPTELEVSTLKQHGWVHLSTVKGRSEKKAMEEKFWVMGVDEKLREIDMDAISVHMLDALAAGAELVQKVSPKSVLPPEQFERYQKARARKQVVAQKAKETKKARAEAKRAREIERAKKLLEEAGVA